MSKNIVTDVEKLIHEYRSGLSAGVLAKRYHTSTKVITGTLKRAGVKLRTQSEACRGKPAPNKGMRMSEEAKRKMREAWKHRDMRGKNHPNYQGKGKYAADGAYLTPDGNGYLRRVVRGHPLADKNGVIGEHVYQACLKYGVEAVRGKDVHHINGDNQDNGWDNLIPLSRSEHRRIENNLEWSNGTRTRRKAA